MAEDELPLDPLPLDPLPPRDPATMDLVTCIALAQTNFGSLPLDKEAVITMKAGGQYRYSYISEGALMARARAILSPLGVAIFTSAVEKEITATGVWVTAEIDFHKTTNGQSESIAIICRGLGQDDRDKAYNKGLTSAVRTGLTKMFLQGGDVDPEQTINEPARERTGPPKLSDTHLKRLVQKAIDSRVLTPDGALDPKLLCRIASYIGGKKVDRMDEIPTSLYLRLVEGVNGKPPSLDGFAADPVGGLAAITEKEIDNGW